MKMTYGSVCSGIEAASVAWEPIGFIPAWFSEIEPFPSAVLSSRWPEVTNHGDMTALAGMVANDNISAPDIIVGGTPCQAFSVAGARQGLSDDRGQLTISYGELSDAIDQKRTERGEQPSIIVWENVPGVLSSKDNAFGALLGLLAGEECELVPPGKKWSNVGYVSGPKRAIAWRVLDAQYFGVAQRRRRVFLVASARTDFNPARVFFESEGVRRDTAPSREARKDTTGSTGNGLARCITAGEMKRQDWETCTFIAHKKDIVCYGLTTEQTPKFNFDCALTLTKQSPSGGGQPQACLTPDLSVRRLTPVECERLQGFPDGHTLVNYRGKPASNGHRYKALGNSMAVPCMAWIGYRIAAQLMQNANDNKPGAEAVA